MSTRYSRHPSTRKRPRPLSFSLKQYRTHLLLRSPALSVTLLPFAFHFPFFSYVRRFRAYVCLFERFFLVFSPSLLSGVSLSHLRQTSVTCAGCSTSSYATYTSTESTSDLMVHLVIEHVDVLSLRQTADCGDDAMVATLGCCGPRKILCHTGFKCSRFRQWVGGERQPRHTAETSAKCVQYNEGATGTNVS